MKISPSVRAAMVPDDNPMHPDYTSIYLVGPKGKQSLTIDSGEEIDRYRWFLKGYLAAIENEEIGIAAITHHHSDHSGNLKWAKQHLNAEIAIPDGGRKLLKGRITRDVKTLHDNEQFDLGSGVKVQILKTPGHSVDSLCYYIENEGVLFTGDTLLGSSTTTVWNLGHYRRSLQRLLELPKLDVICPGHGKIIYNPRERIQQYIDHRNLREQQIMNVLSSKKQLTSWEIMLELYPDIDTRLRRAADGNVRSHLVQLKDEQRIIVHEGKPRRATNKNKIQRDIEHLREEDLIIKKARRLETTRRRKELRAQENPEGAQWIEAPRYEIS